MGARRIIMTIIMDMDKANIANSTTIEFILAFFSVFRLRIPGLTEKVNRKIDGILGYLPHR